MGRHLMGLRHFGPFEICNVSTSDTPAVCSRADVSARLDPLRRSPPLSSSSLPFQKSHAFASLVSSEFPTRPTGLSRDPPTTACGGSAPRRRRLIDRVGRRRPPPPPDPEVMEATGAGAGEERWASLCNCVVNFLLEERYHLTALELLQELQEDGRHAHALRLRSFFSDPALFPPDLVARASSAPPGEPLRPPHLHPPFPPNPFPQLAGSRGVVALPASCVAIMFIISLHYVRIGAVEFILLLVC